MLPSLPALLPTHVRRLARRACRRMPGARAPQPRRDAYNQPLRVGRRMTVAEKQADITALLVRWRDGDRSVEQDLATQLYPVLHQMAGAQVRNNAGALTLSPTELVSEVYTRLLPQREVQWQSRTHFLAVCATVLRRVIVDYLRERGAQKRGAGQMFIDMEDVEENDMPRIADQVDWIAVDQALTQLEKLDRDTARVVELRMFAGLTVEQVAEATEASVATVGRQWRFARAWLAEQLEVDPGGRDD
jgi:RNA polymerase sigma factor (TIGR02999 family)